MNEVIECLKERRSVRKYTDIPIERDVLYEVLNCGIAAPNGNNKQTWKFTVLVNRDKIDNLKKTIITELEATKTDTLHGFENPVAVIIVTDRKNNYNAMANGACAITNILNAAWSLGIGGCWINALRTIQDEPMIREILQQFDIPENHMVIGMVVLGYFDAEDMPKKPRRRTEVVHFVE